MPQRGSVMPWRAKGLFLRAGLFPLVFAAHAEPGTQAAVEQTVATACALRGLTAKRPIVVRPMTEFAGGYTPGLGNAVWEEAQAEQWRAGWCAVGVYCAGRGAEVPASPLRGSSGLYDAEQDVAFVRNLGAPASLGTIAHQTVHALQHRNFPAVSVPHVWDNRDLDSAVNAAIEGDAHLIGWWFRPNERINLCVLDPRTVSAAEARQWQWRPQAYWAHEGFPNVFGPALALGRWVERGVAGVHDLLRNPPLSSRDAMAGGQPRPVDFIALPDEPLAPELMKRGCEVGLTNTVGALGIWGLLALHENASDETAPPLIDQWQGDRFLHVACPGERDDELAWVTRWGSVEAASEFAVRYRSMAASILAGGGVLGAAPLPRQRGRTVVVVTPGLLPAVDDFLATEVRTFADFDAWLASSCFPHGECDYVTPLAEPATGRLHARGAPSRSPAEGSFQATCTQEASAEQRLGRWLRRVRQERSPAEAKAFDATWEALVALLGLCPGKGAGNEDLGKACQAAYSGVYNWLDRRCAGDAPAKTDSSAREPTPGTDLWERFRALYGDRLADRRVAEDGAAGLLALATSPPLSTLAIFQREDMPVDIIALPPDRLAALGCEVLATHVQGVLGTWVYLTEGAQIADATTPPAWLLDWRGDRFTHLRCGEHRGTVWATRWASEASARTFAALVSFGDSEVLAHQTAAGTHTAWTVSAEFAATEKAIRRAAETRTYATFSDWVEDGCFPQAVCGGRDGDKEGANGVRR